MDRHEIEELADDVIETYERYRRSGETRRQATLLTAHALELNRDREHIAREAISRYELYRDLGHRRDQARALAVLDVSEWWEEAHGVAS